MKIPEMILMELSWFDKNAHKSLENNIAAVRFFPD